MENLNDILISISEKLNGLNNKLDSIDAFSEEKEYNATRNNIMDLLEIYSKIVIFERSDEYQKEKIERIRKYFVEHCQDCKDKKVTAVKRTYDYFGRGFATLREYVNVYENVYRGLNG